MSWRFERHHALWERNAYHTPLEKRVRQMSTFILDIPHPNHRLLHASLRPPEKPDHDTLLHMQELAVGGLSVVMDKLHHPIVEHLEKQLIVVGMNPDIAMRRIDTGDFLWRR